jgi:hypothetical protein
MTRYACTEGLVIEPIDHLWAIYCPTSGETLLLNDPVRPPPTTCAAH